MAETTSDEYYQISKAADLALSKVSSLQASMMSYNKALSSSFNELRENIAKVGKASAGALQASTPKTAKKASDGEDKIDKGMEFKPDEVISGAFKGGAALLKMAMNLQQTQASFQQLTHSAITAKALIGSLQQMGLSTPFNSSDLMKNAETLLASGTAAANIVPTLTLLGDASRGNKDKLEALTKAFSQVQTDGKLTADTLKEMVTAGFDPLKEISKASGISMSKLQADLNAGKISVDHLTSSLMAATGPHGEYFGAMQAQSETAGGKWQEFTERMEMAGTSLGNALLPAATDFINNALIPMVTWLETAANWISQHSTLVGFLATVIGGALLGYKLWSAAQGALNLVMNLSPMGRFMAIIGALAGAVLWLWNTFSGFTETIKAFGTLIKDFILDRIKGILSGITGVGQAIMYLFKGEWSKAWETGKNAVKDLVGVDAIKNAAQNAGKVSAAFSKEFNAKTKTEVKAVTPAVGAINPEAYAGLGKTPVHTGAAGLGGAKDKVEGITGGGARNIIINLQKLFDDINIHSTTVKEGVTDMEQMVTEALLRVLNSANAISI